MEHFLALRPTRKKSMEKITKNTIFFHVARNDILATLVLWLLGLFHQNTIFPVYKNELPSDFIQYDTLESKNAGWREG